MSEDRKVDALFVGAHRDDIEITCGGTVRKLADLGYRVAILDLTRGEMGSRGNAGIRKKEAACAAKILGVKTRMNLGLLDAFIENSRENRIKVVSIIRDLKPHLLVLPHPQQRHPDHRKTPELIYDACHISGLSRLEIDGLAPHRPFKIIYSTAFINVQPSFIIDISDQLETKLKAVSCYKSQFDPDELKTVVYPPAFDISDFILTHARADGYKIQVKYGEPFWTKETMLVDDPMLLKVASI